MARDVVIPNAFIPGRQDASGQASPGFMNEAAKSIREVQIAAAGRDSYIPVIYGGPVRTGGLLYLARVYQGKLLLVYIVCEGPIWGYNSVAMNDGGVPASVTVTGYTGSQTTVDPTLAAAIPGFAEVMAGTAYVVCLVPPGASQGFPRFTFEVWGLLVHNPRYIPKLRWKGETTIVPEIGPAPTSFARNLAAYVKDHEDILRLVPANCARFTGARFLKNIAPNSSLTVWTAGLPNGYTKGAAATITEVAGWDGSGSAARHTATSAGNVGTNRLNCLLTENLIAGAKCVISARVRRISGSGDLWVAIDSTGTFQLAPGSTAANGWARFSTQAITVGVTGGNFGFFNQVANDVFEIDDIQCEFVSGQANQAPGPYVSRGDLSFPYHGAGADGCKFFDTLNGNTVDPVTHVVTEATGAAIPAATLKKFRREGARTNYALWNRDLTNAAWTKTNCTAAKTATGPDGVGNSASTLTATAGNATCLQAITRASAQRITGCYIKRRTGSGVINVTQDNGATWAPVTVTSSWAPVAIAAATLANPTIGFQIVTNGDAIDIDFVMHEEAATMSSPIPTTTAAVTRPEDQLKFPLSVFSDTAGSAYAEFEADDWTQAAGASVVGDGSGTAGAPLAASNANSGVQGYDGTNTPTGAAGTPTGRVLGASVWGSGTMQVFAAGVGGSGTAYDGGFGLTTVGIGMGSVPFYGHVGNVEIYDRKFSATAILQFPTTGPWAVLGPTADPQTAYSDNPALCLADFLADSSFGAKRAVDWSTVATAADYCDELCGTEKRALLALALPERRPLADWIDVLRSYVPCWVNDDGDTAQLVPDKARAVDHTFTATNIAASPPPRLFKRGVRDRPTVVQIGYTRTDVVPWTTGYAEATTGSSIRRIARIDMPGIQRYSQARRFAIERLNHYSLEDLEIEFTAFENGLKVRPGDVGAVTDDIGVTAKQFRLLQATDRGFGRWSISGREYDPASYSSVVETAPSSPDTGLPDPRVVAAPTSLVITETVYLEKSIAADALKRGLIYQSRFDCAWTAPVHAYPFKYRLQFLDGAQVVYEGESLGAAFSSPAVQQGKGYTVKVFARNQLGFESEALVGSKTAQGKLLPPGDVPAITQAFEAGGEVILAWDAAIDIDIQFYEWRYGAPGGFSWATATVIDRVDAQRARFLGLPAGTWRLAVKAIDSVGNYSATEKTVDITITVDSDSFLQSREFSSPTLTNMVSAPMVEGVWKPRWITSVASDQWGAVMPNPLSSGSSPVASYHASATSKFVGENWDVGEAITAVWTLVSNATALSGSFTSAIETSLDGSNWTLQPGTTFSGTARYVRPVLEALTTSTMLVSAPPSISFAMQARTETGTVTTLASGGKLVQLSGTYASTKDLQATAINTSAQRSVTVDNILVHSQTGLQLQFDYNGAGDNWVLQEIGGTSRTIVAGDYLEYDVYIDPANPAASGYANGAIYAMFTDASDIAAATDADGYNAVLPATGFDALARGQWKSRKISLAAFVGKQVSRFAVYCPGDAASGTAKVLYRNIRFTDGAGTDRASVWSSGLTALNTTWSSQLTANIRLGPSNAFLIYAFNGATQVAQDARYTYTGY